jgi:hypothetical protein
MTLSALTMEVYEVKSCFAPVAAHRREIEENAMGSLNRTELDRLERRELQLTILAAVFVLVLAGGLAVFMYPLVFLHPVGNKWTLRVALTSRRTITQST